MQETDILCSQKLLCWNAVCVAELVCLLWSSSQCWTAAKVEMLLCPCYRSQCWGSTQRAACSSAFLTFKQTKNKFIDKQASGSWQLVLCSRHGCGRACRKCGVSGSASHRGCWVPKGRQLSQREGWHCIFAVRHQFRLCGRWDLNSAALNPQH